MNGYNMPERGLFGQRCKIPYGYNGKLFVYRIISSDIRSNTWVEPPITYQSENNPIRHDNTEDCLIVVLDTLIDDQSRLIKVATKDVQLMDEDSAEPYIQYSEHTGTKWVVCGVCDNPLCKASDDDKPKFCSECGRRVRWNG